MPRFEVRPLAPDELELAAGLYARAIRDQPTILRAVPGGVDRRMRFIRKGMRVFLPHSGGTPISAWFRGELVGVLGVQGPGRCRMSPSKLIQLVPRSLGMGSPRATAKLMHVARARDRHDLDEPHIHLEPLAVEPLFHGKGVAAAMFEHVIARSERERIPVFAIADKIRMKPLAPLFDFEVLETFDILGIPHVSGVRRPQGRMPARSHVARLAVTGD
ncbi:MAG TPA: GNAT family N-acetyltransferase [Thermoleophilaceae bacterium]|jgi:GNAT superfamily N-acetyltransferase